MTTYNTPDRPDFIRQQYVFAAHIRNPKQFPCPEGIEARRMAVYRELFYNNVEAFIANTYPVLHNIMIEDRWHAMVQDYFANHLAQTPLFPEMPREFLKYLEHERQPQPDDPPFLLELAHYEWVELALSLFDEKIDNNAINPTGDLLEGIPVISPLAWVLSYRFPVHKISPTFQPQQADEANPTHLIVFRDAEFDIHFIETNAITVHLLQRITHNTNQSGQTILQRIAVEMNHPQPDMIVTYGEQLMQQLKEQGILLGTVR
ncbi:MAG: DUF2063 domain-containing protein [Nitrosomonas sp.]|nr:MAG: DUF2063 domain-containing protein [Nitrosomonas sp.]